MARTKRRKKRTHVPQTADPSKKAEPKSFVFCRGHHGVILKALEADLRKVMAPNTATNLKESKRNVLKDFVHIAGPLGVTHFLILTATQNACYLRVARSPRGPTLTLKVCQYSLMRDVVAAQARPRLPDSMWQAPPLLVLNNFGGEPHLQLATTLFQNLFPAINVQTAKLSACQRVVLLSYDKATGRISLRHYNISAVPSGVSKSVKALVARRAVPDMGALGDVSDLLLRSGYGSESEGEEAGEARVTLAQGMGRGNLAARQSRVRLTEVGPRLDLELVKVEEGLCAGRVLHHAYVAKSPAEAHAQQAAQEDREALRAQRRRQQEENVRRKADAAKRRAEGPGGAKPAKRRLEWWETQQPGQAQAAPDDDREYFRQEVGEEPDQDFAPSAIPRSGGRAARPAGAARQAGAAAAGPSGAVAGSRQRGPGRKVGPAERRDGPAGAQAAGAAKQAGGRSQQAGASAKQRKPDRTHGLKGKVRKVVGKARPGAKRT